MSGKLTARCHFRCQFRREKVTRNFGCPWMPTDVWAALVSLFLFGDPDEVSDSSKDDVGLGQVEVAPQIRVPTPAAFSSSNLVEVSIGRYFALQLAGMGSSFVGNRIASHVPPTIVPSS